jgi:RNA-directed DNA polymerase
MQTSLAKPFDIPKIAVWEAYRQVAANRGAPGVDEQSLGEFEARLKGNLYRIWNRMSSGSYMPPPVKAVEIPKAHGGTRLLGVPTVADRVAQTVVANYISEKGGTSVPPGLLWLPSGEICPGCRGHMPAAVLEARLGNRS